MSVYDYCGQTGGVKIWTTVSVYDLCGHIGVSTIRCHCQYMTFVDLLALSQYEPQSVNDLCGHMPMNIYRCRRQYMTYVDFSI